jgi:hypothetical protein
LNSLAENYSGAYICKEMGDKHQTFLFLWSRTPTISDKAVEIYNEFVEKYSLDASVVLHVKQEDCGVAA